MPKRIPHSVDLEGGGGSTVTVYSPAFELPPDSSPNTRLGLQVVLSVLDGGTAPTVGVGLQVSQDGNNWVELGTIWPAWLWSFPALANKFLGGGLSPICPVAGRYFRIAAYPGGTVAADLWKVSAHFLFLSD